MVAVVRTYEVRDGMALPSEGGAARCDDCGHHLYHHDEHSCGVGAGDLESCGCTSVRLIAEGPMP